MARDVLAGVGDGTLLGRTRDGRWLSGSVELFGTTEAPRRGRSVLAELRGLGPVAEIRDLVDAVAHVEGSGGADANRPT